MTVFAEPKFRNRIAYNIFCPTHGKVGDTRSEADIELIIDIHNSETPH